MARYAKYWFTVFTLSAVLLGGGTAGATTNRVLFLGNSFTYYNNMSTSIFPAIAASTGHDVAVESYTPGGYNLISHYYDTNSLALIDQGGWDYVVLQEQSTAPCPCAIDQDYMDWEIQDVENLYDQVKASSPNATIVLYETWAWKESRIISENNIEWGPDAATMQSRISYTYHYVADYLRSVGKNDIRVAHVGDAREVNRLTENLNMFSDDSHPNSSGSYLAGLVIYSTIFGEDPLNVTYDRVNATDAAYIRNLARYAAYLPEPNPPLYPTATVTDTNQVIAWDEPIFAQMTGTNGLASGYRVKRALTRGGPYDVVGIPSTNRFTDTDIAADGPYFYVISATNSYGESPASPELVVARAAPDSPSGLIAQRGPAKVWLTWDPVAGADSYTVRRSATNSGPYATVATGIADPNYVDTDPLDTATYYYVVSASNVRGASPDSAEVGAPPPGGPDLLAYYGFDGNTDDGSGNANHAAATGSPSFVTGKYGSAMDLSGTGQYAMLPAGMMVAASDFTVAVWVNWDGGNNWQRIFDFGNDTTQYLFLTPKSSGGTLRFAIKNGGSEQIVETSPPATGQWVHLAVTRKGNLATLYVNGSAASSNAAVTINPSDFNPAANYIGNSQWPDPLFNGRLDELYIYNYALSASEVTGLMNNRQPPSMDPADVSLSVSDSSLDLSWPADHLGWRLQQKESLMETNWIDVPGANATNAMQLTVETNSSLYYRLVYP